MPSSVLVFLLVSSLEVRKALGPRILTAIFAARSFVSSSHVQWSEILHRCPSYSDLMSRAACVALAVLYSKPNVASPGVSGSAGVLAGGFSWECSPVPFPFVVPVVFRGVRSLVSLRTGTSLELSSHTSSFNLTKLLEDALRAASKGLGESLCSVSSRREKLPRR